MKFNPKNIYGQSIVIRYPNLLPEEQLWFVIDTHMYDIKEFIPKESLHKVKWEVIPCTQPGMKGWKVIVWRYEPVKENSCVTM